MRPSDDNTAYISFGSNVGDRLNMIVRALTLLNGLKSVQIKNISNIYETDPVGFTPQDDFLNGAVEISTRLSPFELLGALQDIEEKLGRTRDIRWGPRTIDLDVVLYDDDVINESDLIVPHPEMQNRGFVLTPLNDIAPTVTVPGIGKIVKELAETTDGNTVRLYLTSAAVKQKLFEA